MTVWRSSPDLQKNFTMVLVVLTFDNAATCVVSRTCRDIDLSTRGNTQGAIPFISALADLAG